ncbi:MAG: GtrA family protein [Patescibacteria group bacterium]
MLKTLKEKIYLLPLFKRSLFRQFIKFCLVGTSNFFVDLGVYWLMTRLFGLHYLIASVISFSVAVTWSFEFNRKWTFRHHNNNLKRQYVKFFIANIVSLSLNLSLLSLLIELAHVPDLWAKTLSALIVAIFNFSLNRFWTFRRQ